MKVFLAECSRNHLIQPYVRTRARPAIWADPGLPVDADSWWRVVPHRFETQKLHILHIWWCLKHFSPSSSFLLDWDAGCFSSVSYCELIILCWSVCVRACLFCYCKRKWQSPSTTSRPHIFECINSMAIANASPVPIILLWIAKMERDRDMGRWRYGEVRRFVCAGVRGWGGHSSLFSVSILVFFFLKKKILNGLCAL